MRPSSEIYLARLPLPIARILHFVLNSVTRIRKALFPSPLILLEIITGEWLAQCLAVTCSLGIPALLENETLSAEDIAKKLDANPAYLKRLMDTMTAQGIFKKNRNNKYALNRVSQLLLPNQRSSLFGMAALTHEKPQWQAWGHLKHGIKTGSSPFELANKANFFDFLEKDQPFADRFTEAMTGMAGLTRELISQGYSFPKIATLIDVGGGSGSLLASFLEKNPQLKGISFDLPAVTQSATSFIASRQLSDRLTFEPGSFFEKAPGGGDYYILKNILHDWSDEECRQILKHIRNVIPTHGKLLIIEMVRDSFNGQNLVELFDMQMLVLTKGGKERSLAEFKALLQSERFGFQAVKPTLAALNIMEFIPAS